MGSIKSPDLQALLNKPLDFEGSTFASSGQMRGTPSEVSSTSLGFGAMGGTQVPFTPSAPRMPVPSTGGGTTGGAPRATGSGDAEGRGGDPNNPLTYLKAIAAHGDLNPAQRGDYERLLREEQNRMRPTGIPVMPSAPVPVLPPAQTSVIRSPLGATSQPPSVSLGTQAGGQTFPAITFQTLLGQALQKVKGLSSSVLQSASSTEPGTLGGTATALAPLGGGVVPEVAKGISSAAKFAPEIGTFLERIATTAPEAMQAIKGLPEWMKAVGKIGGITTGLATLPQSIQAFFSPQTRKSGELTTTPQKELKVQPYNEPFTATPKKVLGTGDVAVRKQALQAIRTGTSKIPTSDLIAGIATPEALPDINKEIDKAQKAGDMEAVQRLSNVYTGVQRQIQFNTILQQAIFAIASGMGSPQAAGVTATRLPMIQQAAGAQLEAPLVPQAGIPQQQEGTPVSYLPPRFPQEDQTQRNKPPIYPWMTGA